MLTTCRRLAAHLLACAALVLAGCGSDGGGAEATATATPDRQQAETGCEATSKPKPGEEGDLSKPRGELDAGKTYVATFVTNCGEFEVTLDAKRSPRTGGSFAYLVRRGFYDGLTFHRIVPGFVIQGGDPIGSGQGGPGYSVVEAPPAGLQYAQGVVAMAKTQVEDPGTSGSQFFVVTGEDAGLPAEYALLGKVTSGLEVVQRIGVQQTGPDERPVDPIVMRRVTIEER